MSALFAATLSPTLLERESRAGGVRRGEEAGVTKQSDVEWERECFESLCAIPEPVFGICSMPESACAPPESVSVDPERVCSGIPELVPESVCAIPESVCEIEPSSWLLVLILVPGAGLSDCIIRCIGRDFPSVRTMTGTSLSARALVLEVSDVCSSPSEGTGGCGMPVEGVGGGGEGG